MAMNYRKKNRQPEAPPQPAVPKVLHSPGGIKGRWMMNSLSFVLVILAAVVILISVGISGYYYATVRDNLVSRATTVADTFQKYFTETYDQFYTQAESTIATFQEQDKLEQQFLDANGRILLSTSGLSAGGMASTEDAATLPIFRPVIAMDKEEIVRIARRIGTFETSIQPFEDCCTVFTPRHPRTHPKVEDVRELESVLDVEGLVDRAMAGTEYKIIRY